MPQWCCHRASWSLAATRNSYHCIFVLHEYWPKSQLRLAIYSLFTPQPLHFPVKSKKPHTCSGQDHPLQLPLHHNFLPVILSSFLSVYFFLFFYLPVQLYFSFYFLIYSFSIFPSFLYCQFSF